jgi:hypothetical protein
MEWHTAEAQAKFKVKRKEETRRGGRDPGALRSKILMLTSPRMRILRTYHKLARNRTLRHLKTEFQTSSEICRRGESFILQNSKNFD